MTLFGKSISSDVKKFECWITCGARVFFAISGRNNAGSAYSAIRKSPCTQDGVLTTSFPVSKVDRTESITEFCFTLPATRWFIASISLYQSRVFHEALIRLELCEGKLSCTVLRGRDGSNPVLLLDFGACNIGRVR
jgi:hypothetical protein